jgi:hypothetical protein
MAEAENFYRQALAIREAALPMEHPHRVSVLEDLANLLEVGERAGESQEFRTMARVAREQHAANEAACR